MPLHSKNQLESRGLWLPFPMKDINLFFAGKDKG